MSCSMYAAFVDSDIVAAGGDVVRWEDRQGERLYIA